MSIRLATHGPPAWVCRPLVAKRVHSTNMFSDVTEILQTIRLIEALHHTQVDWGRHHLWFAHVSLRTGRHIPALRHFATAAVRGPLGPVISDLSDLLRARFPRVLAMKGLNGEPSDAWRATAAAWLQDFEKSMLGQGFGWPHERARLRNR